MKTHTLITLIVSCILLFTACEHETDESEPFTLQEEYNANGSYELEIQFIGPLGIEILNPKFSVALYGADAHVADAPATLITCQHFMSDSLPFTIRLKVPEDASDMIEPVSGMDLFGYYFHLDWDSDNNGQLCEGDLQVDYTQNWPQILMDSTLRQVYYMITLPSVYGCE